MHEGRIKSNEHVCVMLKQRYMYKNIFCHFPQNPDYDACVSAIAI